MARIMKFDADGNLSNFQDEAFNCPHCGLYAQQKWDSIDEYILRDYVKKGPYGSATLRENDYKQHLHRLPYKFQRHGIYCSTCTILECKKQCIWVEGKMIFPDVGVLLPPNNDMPDNVKKTYKEAASIANKSPRAAAALMRLALQELCKHLECKGKKLQEDIDFLVKEKELSPHIIEAMDAVRIIGNEAVHPGTLDLKDDIETATKMFELINFIVEETISKPQKWKSFYGTLPDAKKRKNIPQ